MYILYVRNVFWLFAYILFGTICLNTYIYWTHLVVLLPVYISMYIQYLHGVLAVAACVLHVVDSATGQSLHTSQVNCVAAHENGFLGISGSADSSAKLINCSTGKVRLITIFLYL